MISDFELLEQKVNDLAEMAHALRRENADLRAQVAAVAAENQSLSQRMQAAYDRVAVVLAQLPAPASADSDDAIESVDTTQPAAHVRVGQVPA